MKLAEKDIPALVNLSQILGYEAHTTMDRHAIASVEFTGRKGTGGRVTRSGEGYIGCLCIPIEENEAFKKLNAEVLGGIKNAYPKDPWGIITLASWRCDERDCPVKDSDRFDVPCDCETVEGQFRKLPIEDRQALLKLYLLPLEDKLELLKFYESQKQAQQEAEKQRREEGLKK